MAVVASATGAAVFGLSGVAAGLAGGALLGAGAGALYSGITGDGNILNSALTGGLIGGAVGGLGAAFAPASTVGGLTGASGAAGAMGAGSSLGLGGAGATAAAGNTAALIPAASSGGFGLTAASVPSLTGGLGAAGTAAAGGAGAGAGAGMSMGQILGYGLAGSAAMSLLGNANTPKINSNTGVNNPSYIRPYTYSANPTNNYPTNNNGLGSSAERNYFGQTMTAQPIYKAAEGGLTPSPNLDFMGNGAYPMSQQMSPTYAVPSQMPTSAQQVRASYEPSTNPLTGEPISMAEGGSTSELNNGSMKGFLSGMGSIPLSVRESMGRTIAQVGNSLPNSQPQQAAQPMPVAPRMSSDDAVKAYNDMIMQKAIQTYVTPQQQAAQQSGMGGLGKSVQSLFAPQGYSAPQAPSNFDQTLLDQYRSANPNMRSYNAATQRYGAGIPNQSQYDAFKAQKDQEATDLLAQSQIQPYSYDGGGGAAGGLMPGALRYREGGNKGLEGLSEKEKRSAILDMIDAKFDLAKSQYIEGLGYQTPPPSVNGRLGINMDALGGKIRAGGSGMAMQNPDKKILASPGMMDIGYTSNKESAYDPTFNINLQRSIKSAPGRGKDYAVAANYTMPFAQGGHLGGFSDGGRMLKGPGDGMSDNIPASIGGKQPARLADGEFVVPADVVSHLGNGSTDAGAKRLYAMMDNVRKARTGSKKQGKQIKANKYLPA